ncbi:uncharacterized oxidoreductase [[Candida] railenensis]|uniref:Uncharacterized oxidoreductase n=1 Tax=[Candida] railenensis TaxID=45579 RepID=A0A9P0QL44_9ASCO|nr:uncharacterized oxidoreductase [[Candida] railenensis]
MTKTYLITGANRGIGYALTEELSKRSHTQIIATTRDAQNSNELVQLKEKTGNIDIIELDVSSEESIDGLDDQLKEIAIDGIDVFISNAGISQGKYSVKDAPRDIWLKHYKTNVLGPIFVFQILYPYLTKKETRQIVFVSSLAGSMGQYIPFSSSAYGQSKAALNYTAKEISSELESEGFTVVSMHPGSVVTEAAKPIFAKLDAKTLAVFEQLKITPIDPEESATKQLEVIDNLTKESNGKFIKYDGTELLY